MLSELLSMALRPSTSWPGWNGMGKRNCSGESIEESKVKLSKHGGDRKNDAAKNQADIVSLKHGNQAAYIKARLERDGKAELLGRVNAGEMSAHAAAIEAGWRKRMIQCEPTVEGFKKAIQKHLTAEQITELKERL